MNGAQSTDQLVAGLLQRHQRKTTNAEVNASLRKLRSNNLVSTEYPSNKWLARRTTPKAAETHSVKAADVTSNAVTPKRASAKKRPLLPPAPIESKRKLHVPEPRALRFEFIAALGAEIVDLKSGGEGQSVRLVHGRLLRRAGPLYIYRFQLTSFLSTIDDSPAQLQVGKQKFDCQIASISGLSIDLSLTTSLGQDVPSALIRSANWVLLQMLKEKFDEYGEALDFATSDSVFQCVSDSLSSKSVPQERDCLNDDQWDAVLKSFQRTLSIIWGPPGTGKTQTIAALAMNHVRTGARVLLVSHANTAVDEALEKSAKLMKDLGQLEIGAVVRLGNPKKEGLENWTPPILSSKIAEMQGHDYSKKRDALLLELETNKIKLAELSEITSLADEFKQEEAKLMDFQQMHRNKQKEIADLTRRVDFLVSSLESEYDRHNQAIAMTGFKGGVSRLLRGIPSTESIAKKINNLEYELKNTRLKLSELTSIKTVDQSSRDELERELTSKRNRLQLLLARRSTDLKVVVKAVDSLSRRCAETEVRVSEIDDYLAQIEANVIRESRLLATTLTKLYTDPRLLNERFDVIVLDEASMAPLPQVYWALRFSAKHVVIVGDFQQLPPISAQSKDEVAHKWLDHNIFDVLGANSVDKVPKFTDFLTLLKTQHRMEPDIAWIPNKLFYRGRLENHPSTESLILRSCVGESASLVLVDTANESPFCNRPGPGIRFNIYNALMTLEIAKRLLDDIGEHSSEGVGIIVPYKAQAQLISKIALDRGILDRIRINTVHSFQGGEESAIIFDTVDGVGVDRRKSMLDGDDSHLLLNVALTRAKKKFVLVGDTEFLKKKFSDSKNISKVIKAICSVGKVQDARSFMGGYKEDDFDNWVKKALQPNSNLGIIESAFLTDKLFWPTYLSDLQNAQKRVVIMSPFVSSNRSGKLGDLFKLLVDRGVDISLFVRPANNQPLNLKEDTEVFINRWRQMNIRVITKHNMHEKICIIDDSILWEGSLNILSHSQSTEHMRRFVGENAVKEVVSALELNSDDEPVGMVAGMRCKNCGASMVVRKGRYGKFYGCTQYSKTKCDYKEQIQSVKAKDQRTKKS